MMKMSSGKIVDFSQPNATGNKEVQRLQRKPVGDSVHVIDSNTKQEPMPTDIRVHEEVIVHGQEPNKPRLRKDGNPDLRFRNAPSQAEWDKVKRLEDQ
jgi:hypothetical protein